MKFISLKKNPSSANITVGGKKKVENQPEDQRRASRSAS